LQDILQIPFYFMVVLSPLCPHLFPSKLMGKIFYHLKE